MTQYTTGAHKKRPPSLNTDEDLARDQLNFFRSENILPPASDPTSDDAHLAALEQARPGPTPTSHLLAPVTERVVRRRARASRTTPARPAPPFPPLHDVRAAPSVFRRRAPPDVAADASSARAVPGEAGGVVPDIDNMTPEEIRDALDEIHASMDEKTIQFLRDRGRVREYFEDGSDPIPPSLEEGVSFGSAHMAHKPSPSSKSVSFASEPPEATTPSPAPPSPPAPVQPTKPATNPSRTPVELTQQELLIRPEAAATATQTELEKRQWMTDATQPAPTDTQLDELLQTALASLGDAANPRYNLSATVLTPHEIATLPTHHALHHHGTAPASAGYTLPDLLLLTRSSVLTQRVLSLRILSAIVVHHRAAVLPALVDSGALALVFAPFPSPAAFDAARTNQLAYLQAAETFVAPHSLLAEHEICQALYFASRFYTPTLKATVVPLLGILAESDCVNTLVRIARANVSRDDGQAIATRSLNVVRSIVTNAPKASEKLLASESTLAMLQSLALGPDSLNPTTAMLSCDILAQIAINVGWDGPKAVAVLREHVLSDDFLGKVALHTGWLLRESPRNLKGSQFRAAKGATRLLRAALSFECGIVAFATVTPAVCILAHRDVESATEAYLALEAYVHTLYTKTIRKTTEDVNRDSSSFAEPNESHNMENEGFAKDQLSGLVPVALSAATMFSSIKSDDAPRKKAAAGHFVGTLLAIAPIPLDKTVIARILSECTKSSRKIGSMQVADVSALSILQTAASISHAGARILSKVQLEGQYVRSELECLLRSARTERTYIARSENASPWRPVANACAEWIGALARQDCSRTTVELAICLLPYLSEPQVVVDLLARTVLRAQALRAMDRGITMKVAQKCAQDLLPVTLTELSVRSSGQQTLADEQMERDSKLGAVLVTIEGLLDLWIQHDDLFASFLVTSTVLFKNGLLDPVALLHVLLCAPKSLHNQSDDLFEFTFVTGVAAAKEGLSLIRSREETVVASVSTTGNPKLCDCLLSLAEFLVARGPSIADGKGWSEGVATENIDALASIVLSMMCEQEADASLRTALWTKTIEECGGGTLYQIASLMSIVAGISVLEPVDEPDEILVLYVDAISRGLLEGERCPKSLGIIIGSRLLVRLNSGGNANVLESLRVTIRDNVNAAATRTFWHVMDMAEISDLMKMRIAGWVESGKTW